ncbi:TPA: hypothetical protein QH074_004316 [Enterobacter hormaechei subsp. steigerwaltii]|nr:hypothetical protein [Enterobacter hormaechei subsp. steigerwaltii]
MTTVTELRRAYMREAVALNERFNKVHRERPIRQHIDALNARKRDVFPHPRGRVWLEMERLEPRRKKPQP